ncbi:MAG TPA: T9SS type A sorting domain-containing protein [Saprospiraceae bacterium]|nr:T9SS type A sorting domain-containing protein [Saprospiraceae bacterium]
MKKAPGLVSYKSIRACFSTVSCAFIILISHGTIIAQKHFTAERSFVLKLGTTRPLSESIVIDATDNEKLEEHESNKPNVIPNFAGRRPLIEHSKDALPKGADPLFKMDARMSENEILPRLSFEGLNESISGAQPPDVNGDVGKDYYVEIVNATFFKVYDKTGHAVSGLISANTIWSQVQQSSAGDPILLYDQEVDRWFLTEFPSSNRILIGISRTNDPRGSWDVYTFQTPRFPDFPKYSIWNDSYFMTDNESGANYPIYAINRHDLLSGLDTVRFQRLTVPKINGVFFEVGQPVDWDGFRAPPEGSPGIVVKLNDDDWGTTNQDEIIVYKINIDWTVSANSHVDIITIPVTPYDTDGCFTQNTGGFSCVPQPNGQGIDGAQWIISNKAMYRNFVNHESIVFSFMVDVTGGDVAGIRWVEFRKVVDQEWKLYQEGTVGSDDGLHRFMSSIGIDGQGNIGLAYSISGSNKFPSLRYTGRYSSDPLGEMTFKEFEFATGTGSLGYDRFGDYASMSVDPADDHTFWFSGEYVLANGDWSTRVVAFDAGRDSIDIFPVTLITPKNSAHLGINEPLTVCILNRGLVAVDSFRIGYKFEGGPWHIEQAVLTSLLPDSSYCHTFMTGLDFTSPGNYNLSIATALNSDRNHRNDTLTYLINKPAFKDIAIEYVVPESETVVCSDTSSNTILFRNLGADTITSALMQVSLEGEPVDTVLWTGELAFGQQVSFIFNLEGIVEGHNQIQVTLIEINGGADEIPSNNEVEWIVNARPDGEGVIIHLTTDNFPMETTWELVDDLNQVIASDGPFNAQQHLYSRTLCLDPEMCYTFTVRDAFGDGMSAQGVMGSYEIFNDEGGLLASIIKVKFGASESNRFCIASQCLIDLEVGVEQESQPGAGDAFVIGDVSNGLGTIMYTIDGGINFQTNGTFLNVPPGMYTMIAIDEAGCQDTVDFTVYNCTLETLVTTLPAAGGDVGEIHISTNGGVDPILFSLNGGAFTADSIFTMLEPGDYVIVSRDSVGCERTDSVTVSTMVSTTSLKDNTFIQISPNPGHDLFQITANLDGKDVFIDYSVFSHNGEQLFNGSVVKYNELYKGELSLTAFPPGVYYIAFFSGDRIDVRRVIKVD